jgi:hypothetical protein
MGAGISFSFECVDLNVVLIIICSFGKILFMRDTQKG